MGVSSQLKSPPKPPPQCPVSTQPPLSGGVSADPSPNIPQRSTFPQNLSPRQHENKPGGPTRTRWNNLPRHYYSTLRGSFGSPLGSYRRATSSSPSDGAQWAFYIVRRRKGQWGSGVGERRTPPRRRRHRAIEFVRGCASARNARKHSSIIPIIRHQAVRLTAIRKFHREGKKKNQTSTLHQICNLVGFFSAPWPENLTSI